MAKRKYKKKGLAGSLAGWIAMIIGLIVAIGIGGAFVEGMFLNVVLLEWLPLLVHQIVGWVIISGSVLSFVLSFFK